MALQIHESVGHAVELDRILGWEAAFAGTSWLDLSQLGTLRFGSDLMNITADATLPGALGSFGYDDEGTPAHPVDIVRDGIWVGVLSGRDCAALAGLTESGGAVRGDGYNRLPMVRMTNVGLLPGSSSLEEMIAATEDGILMDTNRSWSIDDKRLNFQFGCEIGWEIKDGKRGRMVKNPTYTGIGPRFWQSLDMLGNASELDVLGHAELREGPARTDRPHRPSGRPLPLPRCAGGGALMSKPMDVAERVLARVGDRAEAEVTVTTGAEALTRFATSFIHQNVADALRGIHLRLAVDGRVSEGSGNQADDASLDRLVASTLDAAALQPVDPGWPGLAPPAEPPQVDHWDDATATAEPDARASRVAAFVRAAGDLESAGYCSTEGVEMAFANSAGQRLTGRATMATLDGIARTGTSDGSGRAPRVRLADLDGDRRADPPSIGRRLRPTRPTSSPAATRSSSRRLRLRPPLLPALYGFNGACRRGGPLVREGRRGPVRRGALPRR